MACAMPRVEDRGAFPGGYNWCEREIRRFWLRQNDDSWGLRQNDDSWGLRQNDDSWGLRQDDDSWGLRQDDGMADGSFLRPRNSLLSSGGVLNVRGRLLGRERPEAQWPVKGLLKSLPCGRKSETRDCTYGGCISSRPYFD